MKKYFKISYKAKEAAEIKAAEIGGSFSRSSTTCPHGRSICYMIFSKDRKIVEIFISCHKCYEDAEL